MRRGQTLHGEKAVIRLFVGSGSFLFLDDLGFPDDINGNLKSLLVQSGGIILVTGPAGSGKTTTIYACLRELVNNFGTEKSLVTLEDPIEAVVPGVAQVTDFLARKAVADGKVCKIILTKN